jgi:hypothetical protein
MRLGDLTFTGVAARVLPPFQKSNVAQRQPSFGFLCGTWPSLARGRGQVFPRARLTRLATITTFSAGRRWIATGVLTSRRGPDEGSLLSHGDNQISVGTKRTAPFRPRDRIRHGGVRGYAAGADTAFSVCVSRSPELDNLKVQVPSGSQTATSGSLRRPESRKRRRGRPKTRFYAFFRSSI